MSNTPGITAQSELRDELHDSTIVPMVDAYMAYHTHVLNRPALMAKHFGVKSITPLQLHIAFAVHSETLVGRPPIRQQVLIDIHREQVGASTVKDAFRKLAQWGVIELVDGRYISTPKLVDFVNKHYDIELPLLSRLADWQTAWRKNVGLPVSDPTLRPIQKPAADTCQSTMTSVREYGRISAM